MSERHKTMTEAQVERQNADHIVVLLGRYSSPLWPDEYEIVTIGPQEERDATR